MSRYCGPLFVAIFALIAPLAAGAASVTFSGTLTEVSDSNGISDGSVTVGTPFSGSFVFEPSASSDLEADPNLGVYWFDTPPWTGNVTLGSYALFTVDPTGLADSSISISVENDQPFDTITTTARAIAVTGPLTGTLDASSFQLFLQDLTALALSSDALDSGAYVLGPWSEASFNFSLDTDAGSFYGVGTLESLVVPEPGSLALLAFGTALLGLRRHSR